MSTRRDSRMPGVVALFISGCAVVLGAQDAPGVRRLGSHPLPAMAVAVSPDGALVASASGDSRRGALLGQVRIWDVASGRLRRELTATRGVFYSVAFSPDGSLVAAGSATGLALIWDARSGALTRELPGGAGPVRALAFSPDGRMLASAGIRSDDVRLWDPLTGKAVAAIAAHSGGVMALAWSRGGELLATVGRDRTLKVWRMPSGALTSTIEGLDDRTLSVTFAPDGIAVAIGGADVTLVDLVKGTSRTIGGHQNTISALAYSPDGRTLVSASGEAEKVDGGRARIVGYPEFQAAPAGSSGRALSATTAGLLRFFDARTGEVLGELSAMSDYLWSAAYTPDGRSVITGSLDGLVRAWPAAR